MQEANVLIIGAGMAGVSAADALRDTGLKTIVLEGNAHRIGGRILSSGHWPDAHIDLGASWITHELFNPLVKVAADNHIEIAPSELLDLSLRTADGRKMAEEEIEQLFALFLDMYAEVKLNAESYREEGKADPPASEEWQRVLADRHLSPEVENGIRFFMNFAIEEPNNSPLTDLSLYNWDDDAIFLQVAMGVFPKGYRQLVDVFAKGIDIRMDHLVRKIAYTGSDVTVSTAGHGDFHAAQAIITLPHAILRRKDVVFEPELPAWKRGWIDRLHSGLSDKFYFRFESVFWDEDPHLVNRIDDSGKGAWSTWINYFKYTGQPVIFAFNRNEHAARLEAMPDDEVIAEGLAILQRAYPDKPLPKLVGFQRSKWGSNPFSRGVLAYTPPGAANEDYANLGKPWRSLRFAGDSTVPEYHGLVMAAYLSGLREARRVRRHAGVLKPSRRAK